MLEESLMLSNVWIKQGYEDGEQGSSGKERRETVD
jgi:hypothetical protein